MTEFAPMGLLPVIASDLGVSIPTAGLLISAYALGVMIGAPLMTLTTGRVPRRTLLIGLAGHLHRSAICWRRSRPAMACCWPRGSSPRSTTAPSSASARSWRPASFRRSVQAGAVAAMFMGLTIANVVGVPLATWAGEHLGWRAAFWGIAALGVVTMAALRLTLPDLACAEPAATRWPNCGC